MQLIDQTSQTSNLMCQQHKQEIIMINVGECQENQSRFLCGLCFQNLRGSSQLMNLQEAKQLIQNRQEQIKQTLKLRINRTIDKIQSYIQQFQQLKETIDRQINNIDKQLKGWNDKLKDLASDNQHLEKNIHLLINNNQQGQQNNYIENVKKYIMDQEISHQTLIEKSAKEMNLLILTFSEQFIEKKYQLKLINKIKHNQEGWEINMNVDGTLMAAGYANKIKILSLNANQMNEIQILEGHKGHITCLIFSKRYNWFISGGGSGDQQIHLWKQIKNNEWNHAQTVDGHKSIVTSLILNMQEDTLFSSSDDRSIIIWSINYEMNTIQYQYTLNQHTDSIYQLSLNQQEDTLISTSYDNSIIIWNKMNDQKYQFYQQIKNDSYGLRITFISENEFLWLQSNIGLIRIYQKQQDGQYFENQLLQLQLDDNQKDTSIFFPCNFNYILQIALLKHNKHVYYLKRAHSGKFIIEQSIQFQTKYIFGSLSNNCLKASIWNDKSKELQFYELI